MIFDNSPPPRRFLIPEVIQVSAMDCGPAALQALLRGFDINVNYGRLREACQTDVDGTSIDTLEELANQLGVTAEQIMLPLDHLQDENLAVLPVIAVVALPNGLTHFVVIWRRHSNVFQVMDPGKGRRWLTQAQLFKDLFLHTQAVAVDDWYAWATSEGFCEPLHNQLMQLGVSENQAQQWIAMALATEQWESIAVLDAVTRMVQRLVATSGIEPEQQASNAIGHLLDASNWEYAAATSLIPAPFWSVKLADDADDTLLFTGAVLVRALGRVDTETEVVADEAEPEPAVDSDTATPTETQPTTAPTLAELLTAPSQTPEQAIWSLFKGDAWLPSLMLLVASVLAAIGVTVEILLLKQLLTLNGDFSVGAQQINIFSVLLVFFSVMLLLELSTTAITLQLGRQLETRFRVALLEKIPRLSDRYFHSRLISDMSERAYGLHLLRGLPLLAVQFLQLSLTLLFSTAGIIWLHPDSVWLAMLASGTLVGLTLLAQPLLQEQSLRFLVHETALSRTYLDSLLGLVPLRTHGAAPAMRTEHESLLVQWLYAGRDFNLTRLGVGAVQLVLSTSFTVWILFNYIQQHGELSNALILLYWSLRLPLLSVAISDLAQQYPLLRSRLLRLLEPLTTPEEAQPPPSSTDATVATSPPLLAQVNVTFEHVSVHAGGHTILANISAQLAAGEHVAVVGPSGAGKSSLVGLLLGWHQAATGAVYINDAPLDGEKLYALRQATAWVDPSVQIWNRSMQDNLTYGTTMSPDAKELEQVLHCATLADLVASLPAGLHTLLGESGGLVSGGEGQRVRLGRAMLRPDVKLVILDEPFRGLERATRQLLLQHVRALWREATLLFISHDVGDTQTFDRVWVIEAGQLCEDDAPSCLAAQPESRYAQLLAAEQVVHQAFRDNEEWRQLQLVRGQICE